MRAPRSLVPVFAVFLLVLASTPAPAAAGDLDPTFGGDGVAIARFRGGALGRAAAVDAEGRLIVAGSAGRGRTAVARFLPDGELDPTFGGDGKMRGVRGSLSDIAVLSDGRIVGVGGFRDGWVVCRITAEGAMDPTFGTHGVAELAYAGGSARGVAFDASGRILVAGSYSLQAALVRYLPGGALDPTFSGDGRRIVPLESPEAPPWAGDGLEDVAPTVDGGLVATGDADEGWIGVVRLNENGSLTSGFGDGGSIVTTIADHEGGRAVAVHDGRILVGAVVDHAMTVLAYDDDGAPVTSFGGGDGVMTIDPGWEPYTLRMMMTTDAEGRIVVGGTDIGRRREDIVAARLDATGDPDAGFGGGGVATARVRYAEVMEGMAVRPDGAIAFGGYRYGPGGYVMVAAQLQG